MKVAIVAVFCACLAVVYSETCSDAGGCTATTCSTGNSLVCERGECTCATPTSSSGTTCTMQTDCAGHHDCTKDHSQHGNNHNDHGHHYGAWHCVDGSCKCFHFGGN